MFNRINKKKIEYCMNCVLPNTRPNIHFNKISNLCNVCEGIKNKKEKINWRQRKIEFSKIANKVIKKNLNYDCLIPVSGGKDSTWQVIKALEYKLKPLCITWSSPARNNVGQRNLRNLIKLGVDHIDFTINPKVESYFTLQAFKKFGNPLLPMHMAMHAIAVRTAIEKNIKLILWGENSADEYGGRAKLKGQYMNKLWRKYYALNYGKNINYWFNNYLNRKNLFPYQIPSTKLIKGNGVTEVFLGYFFKWDPRKIYLISKKKGFRNIKKPKTGYYNFADIDDEFLITIHHYLKWYKFGFTRLWDNLSIEIRNKRLSRKKALSIIKKKGFEKPFKEIKLFCKYTNISVSTFFQICNKLRNKNIWFKNKKKKWEINNFIIKNWVWE